MSAYFFPYARTGATTGPANLASGGEGGSIQGGGILKICTKNWQINVRFNNGRHKKLCKSIKPSDLATADGHKSIGGGKNLGRGGKNPPRGGKKSGEQKKDCL